MHFPLSLLTVAVAAFALFTSIGSVVAVTVGRLLQRPPSILR